MFAPSVDAEQQLIIDQGFPDGWFALVVSDELKSEAVIPCRAFGRDLVLWRTEDGMAHCANAECPHFGVHMGRGGTVKDGGLMCPIHGLRFDPLGRCLPGRPGKPAPDLSIRTYPVAELNGVIHVWRSLAHLPPSSLADHEDRSPEISARRWSVPLDFQAASAQVEELATGMSSTEAAALRIYAIPVETDMSAIMAIVSILPDSPMDDSALFALIDAAFGATSEPH